MSLRWRMPESKVDGTIIIGSADEAVQRSLTELITLDFGKNVLKVSETSDLLLEILDKRVDLTIIDVNLKGLPITKTIQILKKCRPRVPVIVISDDYSVETGRGIMEQGVFYYMYKPLELDSFREIVDSALRKRAREEAQERR
jgi:two-component system nitrogen regulation response regulator GlnG